MFWICLGFVLMSLGIIVSHFNWAPSGVYQLAVNYAESASHGKGKHKNPAKNSPIKTSDAVTDNIEPEKTSPGYTLITREDDNIILVDMDGKVVHTWHLPFGKIWAASASEADRFSSPPYVAYAEVYPNGDVMAIYHSKANKKGPIYGAGIVRMDKEAKVIWDYGANVHDAFYTAKDGRIYTLLQTASRGPVDGLHFAVNPNALDYISVISPTGHQEKRISILSAFIDTPFEEYLYAVGNNMHYIGANSIVLLEKEMAEKFPMFKEGDILLSLGGINTIAVIDPESGKVRWAGRGIFRHQYDARFMENGTIMLYDTGGYEDNSGINRTRILNVDPSNQAVRWVYVDKDKTEATTRVSGMGQPLPNGNVLMSEDDAGQVTELTPDGETVWQYTFPVRITSARRMSYDYLDKSLWIGQEQ